MNLLLDLRILAFLLLGLGLLVLLPAAAAPWLGESPTAFVLSAVPSILLSAPAVLVLRPGDLRMRPRDGFLVVSLAWFMVSLFGALPYWLSGTLGFVDALFESASGFTTTGSTVLPDIEAASRSLLLWRSLTQWLGGMGIIVLAVAVLPLLGIGGMQLFQAEVPGPVAGKLTPRIADTARRLYLVYAGLTAFALAGFWIAGMPFFDALCHALTAPSTGGFSPRNASLGGLCIAGYRMGGHRRDGARGHELRDPLDGAGARAAAAAKRRGASLLPGPARRALRRRGGAAPHAGLGGRARTGRGLPGRLAADDDGLCQR